MSRLRTIHLQFPGSASYWEERYARGGTSGEGSIGELALFKASVLNSFVADHAIESVIEFGCGDGSQLSLAEYPRYVGLDVSATAIRLCRQRFADEPTKRFLTYRSIDRDALKGLCEADLALSLDVIYHLVEDAAFEAHLYDVFAAGRRYVGIYSSDFDQVTAAHVRHRKFSAWVALHMPEWELVGHIPNALPLSLLTQRGSLAEFFFYGRKSQPPGRRYPGRSGTAVR